MKWKAYLCKDSVGLILGRLNFYKSLTDAVPLAGVEAVSGELF